MSSASGVSLSSVIAGSRLMTSISLLRVTCTVLQTCQPADRCLSLGSKHKPVSVVGIISEGTVLTRCARISSMRAMQHPRQHLRSLRFCAWMIWLLATFKRWHARRYRRYMTDQPCRPCKECQDQEWSSAGAVVFLIVI